VIIMDESFMLFPMALLNQHIITEVSKCNSYTDRFGLKLSEQDIGVLVENRKESLQRSGRIEFGGGVIQKIIQEFADSPYIYQDVYLDTITQLQDIFYHYKNESLDELTDDELIKVMRKYFDEVCHGSLEYLSTTALENHCRDIRYRVKQYSESTGYEDNYEEFLDWDKED